MHKKSQSLRKIIGKTKIFKRLILLYFVKTLYFELYKVKDEINIEILVYSSYVKLQYESEPFHATRILFVKLEKYVTSTW